MAPILQLHALKAFYGQSEVVHGIDVGVEEGGMTVLLGANGAGKTTTLRAICGMVRSEGEIRFAGQQLARRTTEQVAGLGVAHVPEGRGTFMALSVEEIFNIVDRIRREERVSVLLVEQNASLALELADHAYLLETGYVVTSGSAKALADDPQIRRSYLGY